LKTIKLEEMASGLASPVALADMGDGRFLVAEQEGLVRLIEDGRPARKAYLDIRDRMIRLDPIYEERGLLGFCLHPDFKENKKCYLYYSAPLQEQAEASFCCTNYLSEFVSDDAGSETRLLAIDKPQPNHNGGSLCFGPDGYLYLSVGDGGGANDTAYGHHPELGNSQFLGTLLGKILRIGIKDSSYFIPQDNPFRDDPEKHPEIYAYGLRNPWRISFDSKDATLYAADVGQDLWEEVDIIKSGKNYGWNIMEATHYFDPDNPTRELPMAKKMPKGNNVMVDPVIEAPNTRNRSGLGGIAIIGGYVYRGQALPYEGDYIFGFWSRDKKEPRGVLAAAAVDQQRDPWDYEQLLVDGGPDGYLDDYLLSFGQDDKGELYILTHHRPGRFGSSGKVYKLVV
jgi:glucose/arabinose dehydrogenase